MAEEVENKNETEGAEGTENLKVLENIDVMLTVEVGRTEITIRDLLRLNEGSVVELDRLAGDPLDIMVNNTKIAKGEVVMVGTAVGKTVEEKYKKIDGNFIPSFLPGPKLCSIPNRCAIIESQLSQCAGETV